MRVKSPPSSLFLEHTQGEMVTYKKFLNFILLKKIDKINGKITNKIKSSKIKYVECIFKEL